MVYSISMAREHLVTVPRGERLVVTDTGHLTGTLTLQDLTEAPSEICRKQQLWDFMLEALEPATPPPQSRSRSRT